jgi:hypothetical protein
MKTLMKFTTIAFAVILFTARMCAQTTTVTATLTDSAGVIWINAPYMITWAGAGNPSTTSGQSFTLKYSGTANSSGVISVAGVTDVKYIAPPNSQWNVCVTSAVSSPTTYCIAASITGTSMNLSTQLTSVLIPPSITGGAQTWAYADSEVSAFAGNQYYRLSDGTFRCYTTSWAQCTGYAGVINLTGTPPSSPTTVGLLNLGTQNYSDTGMIESFQASVNGYIYNLIENTSTGASASACSVYGNSATTASTGYGEVCINSTGYTGVGEYNAASATLFDSVGGDIGIGTATANIIHFFVNANPVDSMKISANGLTQISDVSIPSILAVSGTPTGTPASGGGTVAAGSNYAKIVAVDGGGNQTTVSTESALVTTAAIGTITWNWTAVTGAASYQIWVGSSSGTEGYYFTSQTNSFVQTLPIASGTSGTMPTTNMTGDISAALYSTATNCAVNSVSPAACGSAAAGAFVVPTTTATYTVNTTAVTTHSRIFLQPITFASDLPSSPTCVAPLLTASPSVSAISAGTSFTMALTSTTGTTCWMYHIID